MTESTDTESPDVVQLLRAVQYALNKLPNSGIAGCPGGFRNTYQLASAVDAKIRWFEELHQTLEEIAAEREQPMTDEDKMVEAHKHGIRMSEILLGNKERATFYAIARYHTDHEREAFMAGFHGAQRRSQEFRR